MQVKQSTGQISVTRWHRHACAAEGSKGRGVPSADRAGPQRDPADLTSTTRGPDADVAGPGAPPYGPAALFYLSPSLPHLLVAGGGGLSAAAGWS